MGMRRNPLQFRFEIQLEDRSLSIIENSRYKIAAQLHLATTKYAYQTHLNDVKR